MKMNMSYRIECGNGHYPDPEDDTFTWLNVLGCLLFFVELALFWVMIGV